MSGEIALGGAAALIAATAIGGAFAVVSTVYNDEVGKVQANQWDSAVLHYEDNGQTKLAAKAVPIANRLSIALEVTPGDGHTNGGLINGRYQAFPINKQALFHSKNTYIDRDGHGRIEPQTTDTGADVVQSVKDVHNAFMNEKIDVKSIHSWDDLANAGSKGQSIDAIEHQVRGLNQHLTQIRMRPFYIPGDKEYGNKDALEKGKMLDLFEVINGETRAAHLYTASTMLYNWAHGNDGKSAAGVNQDPTDHETTGNITTTSLVHYHDVGVADPHAAPVSAEPDLGHALEPFMGF